MPERKFDKLSRDDEKKTKIFAGDSQFTIGQMEKEIKSNSKLGRKLIQAEKKLDNYNS
jgi:putative AlgH/UPF0301 family transcriptional regulator